MSLGDFRTSRSPELADERRLVTAVKKMDERPQSDLLCVILSYILAGRIGYGANAAGYVQATEELIEDCRVGVNLRDSLPMPASVVDLPDSRYNDFRYFAGLLAHAAVGDTFGDQVVRLSEERALEGSNPQVS